MKIFSKKSYLIVSFIISFLFLISCSCAEKRVAIVTSYQSLGIVINSLGKSAKVMCNSGEISADKCKLIKKEYNTIVHAYRDAGDLYAKAIQTGADADIKNYQADIEVVMEGLKKIEGWLNENNGNN